MISTARTAAGLLKHLRSLGVNLGIDGDRLTCSAAKGVLTPTLKEELAAQKQEILQFLRAAQGSIQAGVSSVSRSDPNAAPATSFQQQRLWFLEQFAPGNAVYNISGGARLTGLLNRQALELSLAEIIRRHEVLRTGFVNDDGSPRPVVYPAGAWRLSTSHIGNLSEQDQESEIQRLAEEEARLPFDLVRGPLIRARLLILEEREHVLLVSMHHIASDGWSLGIFVRELSLLYPAFCGGQPSPLPELPMQYADYARSQKDSFENGTLDPSVAYWQEQLRGPLPVIDIPGDRTRPPVQTFHGRRVSRSFPKDLSGALQALSLREGATLFMTLLAGFQTLLFRYTGLEEIVAGSANANRDGSDVGDLIGFFVNNLVLRTSFAGDPTVRELIARVRQMALDAYAHQDVPFDHLVEILRPARNLSRPPLFNVMFNLQNFPIKRLELPNLTLTPLRFETSASRFDLTVEAHTTDDGLQLCFEYNSDLFDGHSIARMQEHFQTLLKGMVDNSNQRVSALPMLSPSEHQEFNAWNATAADYSSDRCVHDLIDVQAAARPADAAVVFDGKALTFGEVAQRSNQLAHVLRKAGVGPGKLVGIFLEPAPDMVVALLAVLKAGGAYVPLDPLYPQDRLRFVMEDSGCAALITEERLQGQLPEYGITICLDRDWSSISTESGSAPKACVTPDDLAYVLYTSGSTGRPKGVQVGHRALVNFLESMRSITGITSRDCLVSVTTLSFDIAGLEVYLPLLTGARMVLAGSAVARDGRRLAALLDSSGATIMQATPATWGLLLDAGWHGTPGLKILCGGEALSPKLADDLLQTGSELWNLYGPTETTIWSLFHNVRPGDDPIPIGKPIANTYVYVFDRNGRQVPVNVPGELYIGGAGLAFGYWNRPELTDEKFIPDPFSTTEGARLYRTGDLARFRADGNVEFLGRLDHQVKIRGFRIELGEIEAVLTAHPSIHQVAVTTTEEVAGDRRLVAYLVAHESFNGRTGAILREWAAAKLPEYMIPSTFVLLDKFPLTPNGKIDRRALPASVKSAPTVTTPVARNETERAIAGIWRDVLKVPAVGLHDNFFDLGGHSLLVVRLQSKLWHRFQRELSLVDLFQHPTVSSLAGFLRGPDLPTPDLR